MERKLTGEEKRRRREMEGARELTGEEGGRRMERERLYVTSICSKCRNAYIMKRFASEFKLFF